jgi:hypothetical protein
MQKYIAFNLYNVANTGAHKPAAGDGEVKHVYLASEVDALIQKLSDARLDWGMQCECYCPACNRLDEMLKSLMVSATK